MAEGTAAAFLPRLGFLRVNVPTVYSSLEIASVSVSQERFADRIEPVNRLHGYGNTMSIKSHITVAALGIFNGAASVIIEFQ